MCGRFTLSLNLESLVDRYPLPIGDLPYTPRFNIAPTQPVLTVVRREEYLPRYMRWGLVPYWAKDVSMGHRMINARAESVANSSSFREPLRRRRCLVLADGFYEWKREGRTRVPLRFVLKSREPFALAGVWEGWKGPSGELAYSCAIVTTAPNSLMAQVHDRMPVVLAREAETTWLDSRVQDPGALVPLLRPYPAEEMDAYAVSALVNSVDNEFPDCILPVEPERPLWLIPPLPVD